MKRTCVIAVLAALVAACAARTEVDTSAIESNANRTVATRPLNLPRNRSRVIHTLVALCDNQYQGIVPVPARIGNGDDPANNLYWGAAFGVKNFFKKAADWKLVSESHDPAPAILERVVFKHKQEDVYLVADAYRGREIKQCTIDFLKSAAGHDAPEIQVTIDSNTFTIYAGGAADLIAYVGHDGLMDFSLDKLPQKLDERTRDTVILACISKSYFSRAVKSTGARPLLWTTGLMAPEAYVLKAALDGWIRGEGGEGVRRRAAESYNKYQRCGLAAAMNLFSTGW
jgi:hypothetical protein